MVIATLQPVSPATRESRPIPRPAPPLTLKKPLDNRYTDMVTSVMLARQITFFDNPRTKLTPSPTYCCTLFVALKKVNPFGIKQMHALWTKHPCGGGTQTLPRRASLPPSCAPRNAYIPCSLSGLRILPVTTGVAPSRLPCYPPLTTHCSLCHPFVFILLRIAFPATPFFSH